MVKRKSPRTQDEEGSRGQFTYLPMCVIAHIISLLPAEMILTSRRVCKSWYALTHESSFITKQLQWSKNHESNRYMVQVPDEPNSQTLYLLDYHERKITKTPFTQMKLRKTRYPYQHKLSSYSIVCACNGLLCLASGRKIDNVVIWNRITQACFVLPSTKMKPPSKPCVSYQLGFHFDEYSKKYKVIREFRFFNNQPSKFEIISVGESSWKDLDPPNYVVGEGFDAAIFRDGVFHWKLSETGIEVRNEYILSFDLKEEKFFTVAHPTINGSYSYPRHYKLVDWEGSLKIVEREIFRFVKIWKVIGDKRKGYSIVLQHTYTFCVPPIEMLQFQVFSQVDDRNYMILLALKDSINKSFLEIFFPDDKKIQGFRLDGLPPFAKIITFKPTLVSPFA